MRPELETQLLNCRNLPSPPGVALRIIELAQDPDVVMATAADTIGLDAALSARMLRIANSPLYASRRRVENLSQALTVLGLNATLTLALGFSLAQCGEGSHPVARERVWRRSVERALERSINAFSSTSSPSDKRRACELRGTGDCGAIAESCRNLATATRHVAVDWLHPCTYTVSAA